MHFNYVYNLNKLNTNVLIYKSKVLIIILTKVYPFGDPLLCSLHYIFIPSLFWSSAICLH